MEFALPATAAAVNRNRKPRYRYTAGRRSSSQTQEAPLSQSLRHVISVHHHPKITIVVIVIILVANESGWSLAESISKSNATSVRSPDDPPTHFSLTPSTSDSNQSGNRARRSNVTAEEPVGFRKLKFFGNEPQVLQFSTEADLLEDFTVCTWLKLENTTSNLTLFSYHPMSDSASAEGALRWWVSNGGSLIKLWLKNKLVMKAATKLGDGKWRHICQDWSGSSGNWTLHITGFKSLSGNVEHRGQNWTLPGTGRVRISSERGAAEIYGFTLKQKKIAAEKPENNRRGVRRTKDETTIDVKNNTSSNDSNNNNNNNNNSENNKNGSNGNKTETEVSSTEDPPEVFNSTAEALFWNRGSSRQVEAVSRGFSLGRAAAFLTRVVAFAIIPAMAIINEMRKNRAKSNEIKSIGSNNDDDDDDFTSFKIDSDSYVPVSSTTTKAPEKLITSPRPSPIPGFNTDPGAGGFDNFNFGANINNNNNNFGSINGNHHPPNVDDIDPFFAQDNDFYRSAENKQVQTKSTNQTRTSRSHNSQCQSSRLLLRLERLHGNGGGRNNNNNNNVSIAAEDMKGLTWMPATNDDLALALIGSYCCWTDPPGVGVLVSWFHTPVDHIGGAKLLEVSKSTCGTY